MFLNKPLSLLTITLLCLLLPVTHSYLEFTLYKNQRPSHQQSSQPQKVDDDCIGKNAFKSSSKQTDQQEQNVEYDELCYYKDISYYIELFHQKKLHHIAVDLTSPYSWLKSSDKCTVVETGNKCGLIKDGGKEIKKKRIKRNQQLKAQTTDHNEEETQNQEKNQEEDKISNHENESEKSKPITKSEKKHSKTTHTKIARIEGSNQLVQGSLQQNKEIEFWTKDSGRLSRLLDILMLGFYMIEQKQKVSLHQTNFINTTKLSENMNRLSDGALSLRFDQNSQNSFLQQIFEYTQTVDKMITIYINDKESTLTIGQLSIKNTAEGYSGIVWVPFDNTEDTTAYGKLPLVKEIMLESLANDQQQDIEKDEDNSIFVVFSLSASYIGLPQIAMNELAKQFKNKYKMQCSVSQHSYFECNTTRSKEEVFTQNLLIVMKQGAISLSIESLVLKQSKKKLTLNLRLISKQQNEKQKSFIILGEPYFQKYFTALDYRNNRVGFAIKRTAEHNNFISTVSLIRFVSFLFFTGCCFLICFQPLKKMFQAFSGSKRFYNKKSPQGRRLKYEPIQENPYEQVAGTLKKVMEENEN